MSARFFAVLACVVWSSRSIALAQSLLVGGTTLCERPDGRRWPAGDVLVVHPESRTASAPGTGLFTLKFTRPRKIRNRDLELAFWPNETKELHRWFVPFHLAQTLEGAPAFIIPEAVALRVRCDDIHPPAAVSAEAREAGANTGFVGHLLQVLAVIAPAAAAAPPGDEVVSVEVEELALTSVSPSNESSPLYLARTSDFPVLGFRYAPRSYAAAAMATNPAAIAMGDGFEIHTNGAVRRSQPYRFSASASWADGSRWGVGIGYYGQITSTARTITYDDGDAMRRRMRSNSHAFLLVPSFQIHPLLAVAAGAVVSYQAVEEPTAIRRTTTTYRGPGSGEEPSIRQEVDDALLQRKERGTRADALAGVLFEPIPHLRIGASAASFIVRRERYHGRDRREFVLGTGASAVYQRVQVGADLAYSRLRGLDGSVGASIFVRNPLELGAGYLTEEHTVRVWARIYSAMVSLARTRDNDWLFNVGGRATF